MRNKRLEETAQEFEAKIALAEAWSRKEAINHITHRITGGYMEFYKARLSEKNGLMDWVEHWDREVYGIIQKELAKDLLHPIKGFSDKRKVYDAVKAERMSVDSHFRRVAENIVKNDFKVSKLQHSLTDEDKNKFWAMVDKVVDLILG